MEFLNLGLAIWGALLSSVLVYLRWQDRRYGFDFEPEVELRGDIVDGRNVFVFGPERLVVWALNTGNTQLRLRGMELVARDGSWSLNEVMESPDLSDPVESGDAVKWVFDVQKLGTEMMEADDQWFRAHLIAAGNRRFESKPMFVPFDFSGTALEPPEISDSEEEWVVRVPPRAFYRPNALRGRPAGTRPPLRHWWRLWL